MSSFMHETSRCQMCRLQRSLITQPCQLIFLEFFQLKRRVKKLRNCQKLEIKFEMCKNGRKMKKGSECKRIYFIYYFTKKTIKNLISTYSPKDLHIPNQHNFLDFSMCSESHEASWYLARFNREWIRFHHRTFIVVQI